MKKKVHSLTTVAAICWFTSIIAVCFVAFPWAKRRNLKLLRILLGKSGFFLLGKVDKVYKNEG